MLKHHREITVVPERNSGVWFQRRTAVTGAFAAAIKHRRASNGLRLRIAAVAQVVPAQWAHSGGGRQASVLLYSVLRLQPTD